MLTQEIQEDLQFVVDTIGSAWDDLDGAHLFITGGTGFFGTWLLASLLQAVRRRHLKLRITVLTRSPASFARKQPDLASSNYVEIQTGCVTTFQSPKNRVTHAIHAACRLQGDSHQSALAKLNDAVLATSRVIQLATAHKLQKLLFTSSGAVYGPRGNDRENIRENSGVAQYALNPKYAYAEGKRFTELALAIAAQEQNFQLKIARGFAFIGPFMDLNSNLAATSFLRSTLKRDAIRLTGNPGTCRSYMYGADLAIWLWKIFFEGENAQPYNVGSDEPITMLQLAEKIGHHGTAGPPIVPNNTEIPQSPDYYLPDIALARDSLGLQLYTSLDVAIAKTFHYFKGVIGYD